MAGCLDPAELAALPNLIHGFRTDEFDWLQTWNVSLDGTRVATEMVTCEQRRAEAISAALEARQPDFQRAGCRSLRDVSIEDLALLCEHDTGSFASGFATSVLIGSLVRTGRPWGYGAPPTATTWASTHESERILAAADRELFLEAARRKVAPDAASRLTCLWCADDSTSSRNWVQGFLGLRSFVVPVTVQTALRITRCDARWLDAIGDADAAVRYWTGEASATPQWEFLIEGTVRVKDADDLRRIREFVQLSTPPSFLVGPPASDD